MASPSYRNLLSDIRAKRLAPLYILSGEEAYYIDLIADALQQTVVPADSKDFDQHIFYGQDADLDLLVNTARQYPLMSEHKLVMLREAQSMQRAKIQLDKLQDYLENPSPTTVFVVHFKGEAFRDNSKLVKAAKNSGGVVYASPKVRDYELPRLLREYCKENGVTMEPKAEEMLCQSTGTNLQKLFGEVNKLRLTLPKGDHVSISADMVEKNTGVSKQYNSFELRSKVMRRDYDGCMKIARYYEANPNARESAPEVTSATLFRGFADLLQVHYMRDKSDSALRTEMKLNFKPQIDEIRTGLRNYSAWSCLRIIHAIRDYDCHTKGIGSAQPRQSMLYDLIYRIFTL